MRENYSKLFYQIKRINKKNELTRIESREKNGLFVYRFQCQFYVTPNSKNKGQKTLFFCLVYIYISPKCIINSYSVNCNLIYTLCHK